MIVKIAFRKMYELHFHCCPVNLALNIASYALMENHEIRYQHIRACTTPKCF